MARVKVFWDPAGLELDALGAKTFLRATDGDTPYVSMSIRMLSIDTPEVHYPGNQNPARHDQKLAQLADWLQRGKSPANADLAAYLHPKLASGQAGSLQKRQGEAATEAFRRLVADKLTKPNGRLRTVFLRTGETPFDHYGRLLAYMAPNFSAAERAEMDYHARATFNLLMVESGWAAPFPIYPSLPKYRDLILLHDGARKAVEGRLGAWADPLALTGYEYRMAYRLWQVTDQLERGKKLGSRERYAWIDRYCADMTTLAIHEPQDYHKVAPQDRIFLWPADVGAAVARLNLVPAP